MRDYHMGKGLVSVIIPTYNLADTIIMAIDSALSQDYPSLEVLVIDDGSKDNTGDKIRHVYKDEPRLRYIRQENGGVCSARNHGIREARGEFIAMLDADDYWLPGKMSLQVSILNAHPELSLVWSDMDAINPDGEIAHSRYLRKMYSAYNYFPKPEDLFSSILSTKEGITYLIGDLTWPMVLGNLIHTSTVLARADRLRQAGWYDQTCYPSEDQDYYFRVCKTGPVALVDAVTLHYRIGSENAATGPAQGIALATSYLRVLNSIIEKEGDNIRLPKDNIRRALCKGYVWAGQVYFYQNLRTEARAYLLKALKTDSFINIRAWRLLIATFLPSSLLSFLRSARNRVSLYFLTMGMDASRIIDETAAAALI
jgi:glycosyltransferase involved in cell wall biosynthesis